MRRDLSNSKQLECRTVLKKCICENCGIELNEEDVDELDGAILCEICYDEEEDLRVVEEDGIE